jgi:hypothetical protein
MIRILLSQPTTSIKLPPQSDETARKLAGKKISDLSDQELRQLAEILCKMQGLCDTNGTVHPII